MTEEEEEEEEEEGSRSLPETLNVTSSNGVFKGTFHLTEFITSLGMGRWV